MVSEIARRVTFSAHGNIQETKWDATASVKVMVAFGPQTFNLLESEAKERGISIQELLRAVIIPEWFRVQESPGERQAGALRARLEPQDSPLTNNSRPGNHRI